MHFLHNITRSRVLNIKKKCYTASDFRTKCTGCETRIIQCKHRVEGSMMPPILKSPYSNEKSDINETEIIR